MKPIIPLAILVSSLLTSAFAAADCTNRNVDITSSKPNSLYTDHADGTVTDNETGLMWQKCILGLSNSGCLTGVAQGFNWQAALAAANDNTDYGYDDWRLPNKNELESLVEYACFTPTINEAVFPSTFSNYYWSSSPSPLANTTAWRIGFINGDVSIISKNSSYYVRLVRSNQSVTP